MPHRLTALLPLAALLAAPAAAATFVNNLSVASEGSDFSGQPAGAFGNRLAGLFSDLAYDRATNSFFGVNDRGPHGGDLLYRPRANQFTLSVNPATGAISDFRLRATPVFREAGGALLDGRSPGAVGDRTTLGRSFDPEGIAVGRSGTLFVADEYGPSVKEFSRDGTLLRTFTPPANLVPRRADDSVDFTGARPTITQGRQDNRGYEGLAVSPDGSRLYAVLQNALVNEGSPDGRFSRNLRIVEYDTATGQPLRQFIYQLEALADINARIPGTANDFAPQAQGRNIGVSAITAINATQFLVVERDNRGFGTIGPSDATVGTKRVYLVDIAGATDVSATSLGGVNGAPPAGVVPVGKTLVLDVVAALRAAGLPVPEKIEGAAIGPRLANGDFSLILGTDNDFSVNPDAAGGPQDVCADGVLVGLDSGLCLGRGSSLVPNNLYSFAVSLPGFLEPTQAVPGPAALPLLGAGLLGLLALRRRR